ncbi:MAG: hypothetical protein ACPGQL_03020 [Thermoplasmatota archaeon]
MRVVFVGRDRKVPKRLVFYLLTFGISRRIWLHRINKEVDGHEYLSLNTRLIALLLALPIIGPTIVTRQSARRVGEMLDGSPIKYGPPLLLWLATWIPLLGNLFFIAWTQSRLNRFWVHQRQHPEHGVEVDLNFNEDRKFLIELENARRQSYYAGSQYDRRRERRREIWAERRERWDDVQSDRVAVREAGGSTPVLPWKRPERPAKQRLKVTCGTCETAFSLVRDPLAETSIVCPKCATTEVLPSLRGDTLRKPEKVNVPRVAVDCPRCQHHFTTGRKLREATPITCPNCGLEDSIPPSAAAAPPA